VGSAAGGRGDWGRDDSRGDWGHDSHDDHPWHTNTTDDGREGHRGDWWDKIHQAQQGNQGASTGTTPVQPCLQGCWEALCGSGRGSVSAIGLYFSFNRPFFFQLKNVPAQLRQSKPVKTGSTTGLPCPACLPSLLLWLRGWKVCVWCGGGLTDFFLEQFNVLKNLDTGVRRHQLPRQTTHPSTGRRLQQHPILLCPSTETDTPLHLWHTTK
jgi:hypothetical protein